MLKVKLLIVLTVLCACPAAAAPNAVLPDTSTYYYWFRSAGGSVAHGPKASNRSGTIDIGGQLKAGGTLYILDPHTGGIAAVPLVGAAKGAEVAVEDFHVPAATPSATSDSTSASPTPSDSSGTGNTIPGGPQPSILSRIVTGLLGLAVFGGVIWFIRKLITTRGQLLIDTARKVGVDVPNPDDLPPSAVTQEGKYEAPPVPKVQKIPEAATRAPQQASSAGYLVSENGTSYTVGGKTTSIGRVEGNDIILPDGSVSRRHARIEYAQGSAVLIDEGSANGVFINGQKIATQALSPGDSVKIGHVMLRYER